MIKITPGEGSEPTAPSAPYYGYYSCGTVDEPSTTNPTVTVPDSFSCSYDGSGRQVIGLPMVGRATSGAQTIQFKHLTAAVKVMVRNEFSDKTLVIDRVVVSSDYYDLSGDMTLNLASANLGVAKHSGSGSVTVNIPAGLTLPFYDNNDAHIREVQVPIRPIDNDHPITITVYTHESGKVSNTYVFNHTENVPTLTRNMMLSARCRIHSGSGNHVFNALSTPLTFEARDNNFKVSLSTGLAAAPSLQYSIDGGDWTDCVFPSETPSINTGHTISFRAKTTNGAFADDEDNTTSFACSEACYIYGNVMSLLSKDDFATATSVPEYAFLQLFSMNSNISSHPTKSLVLPATTLATSCYEGMFMMCSGLTTAPNLPATTLATSCYKGMFLMCSGLTTAPNLPATSLATSCYNNMFLMCSGLTTAPNLPATTLAESCYDNMFSGCTGLVNAPEISATTLAAHCCATMFYGCTSLVTGPTLSATTLTDHCYSNMFYGCSSLTSVTCLATNISADYCLGGWLVGATATGTLYVDASMTGASWGVPGTWSVAAH